MCIRDRICIHSFESGDTSKKLKYLHCFVIVCNVITCNVRVWVSYLQHLTRVIYVRDSFPRIVVLEIPQFNFVRQSGQDVDPDSFAETSHLRVDLHSPRIRSYQNISSKIIKIPFLPLLSFVVILTRTTHPGAIGIKIIDVKSWRTCSYRILALSY